MLYIQRIEMFNNKEIRLKRDDADMVTTVRHYELKKSKPTHDKGSLFPRGFAAFLL